MALTGRPARREPATPVELRVDWLLCDGNGVCAELLPELVTSDDWGYPVLAEGPVPAELHRLAVRARAACPAMAFSLRPARESLR